MIVNDRIVTYIHSLEKANSDLLEDIERQAHIDGVPIIRKEMESFLRVMIGMNKPKKILELGTAVAYSAILMSECCDANIVTIENYEPRIIEAKKNIARAQKENVITLLEGDAIEILENMDDEFDFVFMDAAKAQYINFLPHVMRLLKKGGILIADNVLQEGDLIESKFATRRRDRTIHTRMREFMYEVKHNPELETTIVPIGDGVTVSIRL